MQCNTSRYYTKFLAFCKGSAVFQVALGLPAGETCLVLRTEYGEMRPIDCRENCITVPAEAGVFCQLQYFLHGREKLMVRGTEDRFLKGGAYLDR